MVARSTINHLRERMSGVDMFLSEQARQVESVSIGLTGTQAAATVKIFRAPASGAILQDGYVCLGTIINATAGINADLWGIQIYNESTGNSISLNNPSLSGQALSATGYKLIPSNGGNSTMQPGDVLSLRLTVTGTPQGLNVPNVVIPWTPLKSA